MAQRFNNRFLSDAVTAALAAGTPKLALFNGGTINPDHDMMSDGDGTEVTTTNYVRKTLGSVTVTPDETNDKVVIDCDDVVYSNTGVPAGAPFTIARVFVDMGGADSANPIVFEFDASQSFNGGNCTVTVNASGLGSIVL